MKICPLSQAYFLDRYEKRVSPQGEPYFWLGANDTSGVPLELLEPGSDYAFLHEGHVTCTFLGAFSDHNRLLEEKMQDFAK